MKNKHWKFIAIFAKYMLFFFPNIMHDAFIPESELILRDCSNM